MEGRPEQPMGARGTSGTQGPAHQSIRLAETRADSATDGQSSARAQAQAEMDQGNDRTHDRHAQIRSQGPGSHGPRPIYAFLRFKDPHSYTPNRIQARSQAQHRANRSMRLKQLGIPLSRESTRNQYKLKWKHARYAQGDIRGWAVTTNYRPSTYKPGTKRKHGPSVSTEEERP